LTRVTRRSSEVSACSDNASDARSRERYWVRTDRTNRGYASAAAAAITAAGFAFVDDIDSVEIHINRANHASAAIPPKLGYHLANEGESLLWVKERPPANVHSAQCACH